MTLTPGKLYRLKNCSWFVFKFAGKLHSVGENHKEALMFIKEEKMEAVNGSKLFFLFGDKLLETNSSVSNDGRHATEITRYLEEVVI